jgi:hypothetical protein
MVALPWDDLLNLAVFHTLMAVDFTGTEMPVLVTHIVFSMIAAGVYKGLAARRSAAGAPPAQA